MGTLAAVVYLLGLVAGLAVLVRVDQDFDQVDALSVLMVILWPAVLVVALVRSSARPDSRL